MKMSAETYTAARRSTVNCGELNAFVLNEYSYAKGNCPQIGLLSLSLEIIGSLVLSFFSFYSQISVIYKLTMFAIAFGETSLPWLSGGNA